MARIKNMKIEKNESNLDIIKKCYENNEVIFEHTVLESSDIYYSICYCAVQDIYDILIMDRRTSKVINYEARKKLSNSTLKYFNVYKDDVLEDNFGNRFICSTHHIETR